MLLLMRSVQSKAGTRIYSIYFPVFQYISFFISSLAISSYVVAVGRVLAIHSCFIHNPYPVHNPSQHPLFNPPIWPSTTTSSHLHVHHFSLHALFKLLVIATELSDTFELSTASESLWLNRSKTSGRF